MTTDLALGANTGIETVVTLVNLLNRELKNDRNQHPTTAELSSLFQEYQNDRQGRLKALCELSRETTSRNMFRTLRRKLEALYLLPVLENIFDKKLVEMLSAAPKLDFAPLRDTNDNAEAWVQGRAAVTKGKSSMVTSGYLLAASLIGLVGVYAASPWGRESLQHSLSFLQSLIM